MIPLIKLKKEVQFNRELTQVVDVLKGIAAARFFSLQRKLQSVDLFMKSCEEFFAATYFAAGKHPFLRSEVKAPAVLMITSDAGFLGGLNTTVVHKGLEVTEEAGGAARLSVIGERGANYLKDLHRECASFPGIQDANETPLAFQVRDHMVQQVLRGECGSLVVIYPKPVSFAVQQVTAETLLPFQMPPALEKESRKRVAQMIWESKPEKILEYVILQWVGHGLAHLFALSRLAEMAARAVHLEGSYQELTHMGKRLRGQYFRVRHEIIDRSMREIYASQLLFRGKG